MYYKAQQGVSRKSAVNTFLRPVCTEVSANFETEAHGVFLSRHKPTYLYSLTLKTIPPLEVSDVHEN